MKVGVSGHQNIPQDALTYLEREIRLSLSRMTSERLVGISSLAAGADQLFARIILDLGGDLEVVVPCHGYESTFSEERDLEEYRRLLHASVRLIPMDFPSPSEAAYLAAGIYIVDNCDSLIAVWDGLPARGKGGTGDIVDYARREGVTTEIFWPTGVARD